MNTSFWSPCVGAGNFVFSYIKQVVKNGISKDDVFTLLDNIYVADINPTAIETYKSSLKRLSRCLWEIELDDEYFANHIGTGLLVDVTASKLQYIKIDDVLPSEIRRKMVLILWLQTHHIKILKLKAIIMVRTKNLILTNKVFFYIQCRS